MKTLDICSKKRGDKNRKQSSLWHIDRCFLVTLMLITGPGESSGKGPNNTCGHIYEYYSRYDVSISSLCYFSAEAPFSEYSGSHPSALIVQEELQKQLRTVRKFSISLWGCAKSYGRSTKTNTTRIYSLVMLADVFRTKYVFAESERNIFDRVASAWYAKYHLSLMNKVY